MNFKVYVGNLPRSVTEDEVRGFFSSCGEIDSVLLIKDRETNELKGFGFISFKTQDSMQKALAMNEKELGGRKLNISVARERSEGGRSGGGRSGAGGNRGGFRKRY